MKIFKPCEHVTEFNVIDIKKLFEKGIRGVIIDIDNTLVPHGELSVPENVRVFFSALQSVGIKALFLSNNHEERVKPFSEALGVPFICDAGKPLAGGYKKSAEKLGLPLREVAVLGDQLFTDMLGGNLLGLYTILVTPVDLESEYGFLKFKRILEKLFRRDI